MKDFQLEALVVTAVKMLAVTREELTGHDCDWCDPVAVHYGNVYQCICYGIYAASGTCGNPSSLFQVFVHGRKASGGQATQAVFG